MDDVKRRWILKHLTFQRDSQKSDLLDRSLTTDNLLAAIGRAVLPEPAGQGHKLLITSVRTDHSDDRDLGPHCHARGYAVDLWPVDVANMDRIIQDFCSNNRQVMKIGLGGSSQSSHPEAGTTEILVGDTLVFDDNSSDHIHVQVGSRVL